MTADDRQKMILRNTESSVSEFSVFFVFSFAGEYSLEMQR